VEAERLHDLRPGARALAGERDDPLHELGGRRLGPARADERPRLAHRGVEARVVARRDEVHRRAHQQRLDDAALPQSSLERRALEAFEPRPEREVRGRGQLRLQPREPLDRPRRRQPLPAQQQLSQQRRAVQLALREDPLRHATTLPP
jgi:hypothetical protein